MTEDEARAAILANGYRIMRERERSVVVIEPGRRASLDRYWRDLALTFHLDKRPINTSFIRDQKR